MEFTDKRIKCVDVDMDLNPHISNLRESATLKINEHVRLVREKGKQVHHFGFGQSPFPLHPRIVQSLKDNAHQKDYLPTRGLKQLRETIVGYYRDFLGPHPVITSENVLIGPGSKELLFQTLFSLNGPVLIPAPCWVSYGPQVHVKGQKPVFIMTQREQAYKLEASSLDHVCGSLPKGQKTLILNSPNNPTGSVYHEEELKAIAGVCKKHGVLVISDEIYAPIDWSHKNKKSFLYYYPQGTIVSSGLSKAFSGGGYRLGYLIIPSDMEKLIQCLVGFISETFSSVCAPVSYAAIEAFSRHKEVDDYVFHCTKIHEALSHYIYERMDSMKLLLPKPQGAFYFFVDFEPYRVELKKKFHVQSSSGLAELLLKEADCAFLPGSEFCYPEEKLCLRGSTVDYDGERVYLLAQKAGFEIDASFVENHCSSIKMGLDKLENFLKNLSK